MDNNTVESEVDWKAAYQFEHEEHKKTLLILDKAMEESIQVFLKTRDMIRMLEHISEQRSEYPQSNRGEFRGFKV